MEPSKLAQFIKFLREELGIPDANLQLALRYSEQMPSLLPMILWQYGLASLAEVSFMFDWLEHHILG